MINRETAERVVGLPIRIKEATEILIEVYGENLLTEREYDRRLKIVQNSETLDEVDNRIWDLPQNFLDKLTKFENYSNNSFGALDSYSLYLKNLVTNELDDGELISWVGQISKKTAFLRSLPAFFFGIPFTAFALFWMISAGSVPKNGGGIFNYFFLFGLPFILAGLGMLLSPFIAISKAKKSLYIITDRRAIIIDKTIFSNDVKSFYSKDLSTIETKQNGNDRGDIIFSSETRRGNNNSSYEYPIGFFGVKDFNEGKRLLKELKRNSL